MAKSYSSSLFVGGNPITPDRIILEKDRVVYRKRNPYLIGVDEESIPYDKIASVDIDKSLIDVEIKIYSSGRKVITARNFTYWTARKIKKEIERKMY